MQEKLGDLPLGSRLIIDGRLHRVSARTPGLVRLTCGNTTQNYSGDSQVSEDRHQLTQPTWTSEGSL